MISLDYPLFLLLGWLVWRVRVVEKLVARLYDLAGLKEPAESLTLADIKSAVQDILLEAEGAKLNILARGNPTLFLPTDEHDLLKSDKFKY